MRVSSVSPEQRTVLTRSHCAGDSAVSASSCPTAIMPFSGVRISWLMRARNCDFASAAAAACNHAPVLLQDGAGLWHIATQATITKVTINPSLLTLRQAEYCKDGLMPGKSTTKGAASSRRAHLYSGVLGGQLSLLMVDELSDV